MKVFAAILALFASSALAFAPASHTRTTTTSSPSTALQFSAKNDEDYRKVVSGVFVAAFLAFNAAAFPAFAMDERMDFGGSTEILAARSGGRSGGRASSGGNSKAYRSSAPQRNTYKSYSSTTVVSPPSPTVVVSPSYGFGYGYQPPSLGGIATGYALGSLGNIGNNMQDYRQEQEIQRSRYELEQARMKEAELEGRLRALEQPQAQQPR